PADEHCPRNHHERGCHGDNCRRRPPTFLSRFHAFTSSSSSIQASISASGVSITCSTRASDLRRFSRSSRRLARKQRCDSITPAYRYRTPSLTSAHRKAMDSRKPGLSTIPGSPRIAWISLTIFCNRSREAPGQRAFRILASSRGVGGGSQLYKHRERIGDDRSRRPSFESRITTG